MSRDSTLDSALVVFSDLDGTLLDHDTYQLGPAADTLAELRARQVPVVLATSKTRDEVLALRSQWDNRDPFIVENGGALYIPEGYFADPADSLALPRLPDAVDGLHEVVLGAPYDEIREVLQRLRQREQLGFEGFGDVSDARVAQWTGLSLEAAAMARARASSEPLLFDTDGDDAPARLRAALEAEGLSLVRGGRFFSAQGRVNKGSATRYLLPLFADACGKRPLISVAAGDSDNDLPMLQAVDIPIVIPPKHGGEPLRVGHPRVIQATRPGPAGFAEGIARVLAEL